MTLPGIEARAELVVDLDAIAANVANLKERAGGAAMMTVVKADGYGHGIIEAARAARSGGADWLGTAVAEEALTLREAGDTGRILTALGVEDTTDVDVLERQLALRKEPGAEGASAGVAFVLPALEGHRGQRPAIGAARPEVRHG